jgi:hypothetical protein
MSRINFGIGDYVGFYSLQEDFSEYNLDHIEDIIEDNSWYEVKTFNFPTNEFFQVWSNSQEELITINKGDYQVHTKNSLREILLALKAQQEADKQYHQICKKIRELYKKQQFKFAT